MPGRVSRKWMPKMLELIDELTRERGFPPTIQELAERLGKSKTVVHEQFFAAVEEGFITHVDRRPRTVKLTDLGRAQF